MTDNLDPAIIPMVNISLDVEKNEMPKAVLDLITKSNIADEEKGQPFGTFEYSSVPAKDADPIKNKDGEKLGFFSRPYKAM